MIYALNFGDGMYLFSSLFIDFIFIFFWFYFLFFFLSLRWIERRDRNQGECFSTQLSTPSKNNIIVGVEHEETK